MKVDFSSVEEAIKKALDEGITIDEQVLQKLVNEAMQSAAALLYTDLKTNASGKISEQHDVRVGFEQRLYERWKQALDLFDLILIVVEEAGSDFLKKYHRQAVDETNFVLNVLIRLHARACLTTSEVGSLLRSGHAAGALARWRTLHELSVVAHFISAHGQVVAERYLLHEVVEAAKAAKDYERCYTRLRYEPIDPQEVEDLQAARAALCQRFGKAFGEQYGWAAEALNKQRPSFADIERSVNLDFMRAHYRMSSHGVHPNLKGSTFNPGILGVHKVLLSGPSNAGLADAGHASLISLIQCTTVLLSLVPKDETVIISLALLRLVDDAGQAFLATHENLIREEDEKLRG